MKVALTGCATGIGAEVAKNLTTQGHAVTAFDFFEPSVGLVNWIKTDLRDSSSIAAAVAAADAPFDALINNADLPPRVGLKRKKLEVNFFGFHSFLTGMLDRLSDRAAIVNMTSRAGATRRENLDKLKALMSCPSGANDAETWIMSAPTTSQWRP